MASVAPKVSRKAGSAIASGSAATMRAATTASAFSGAEVHHRHQRRAIDRGAAAHKQRVRDEGRDRRQHRCAAEQTGAAKGAEEKAGEDRDVAAGDRDHVIRARFLQSPLHVVVQTGAIADDDRRHDRGGLRAPAADGAGDGVSRERPHARHRLVEPRSAREDLDERAALDRADQCGAAPRERALVIRNAGIEIPRRTAKHDRHPHATTRAPVVNAIAGERTDDRDKDPAQLFFTGGGAPPPPRAIADASRQTARHATPARLPRRGPRHGRRRFPPVPPIQPVNRDAERHAGVSSRRVGA